MKSDFVQNIVITKTKVWNLPRSMTSRVSFKHNPAFDYQWQNLSLWNEFQNQSLFRKINQKKLSFSQKRQNNKSQRVKIMGCRSFETHSSNIKSMVKQTKHLGKPNKRKLWANYSTVKLKTRSLLKYKTV